MAVRIIGTVPPVAPAAGDITTIILEMEEGVVVGIQTAVRHIDGSDNVISCDVLKDSDNLSGTLAQDAQDLHDAILPETITDLGF